MDFSYLVLAVGSTTNTMNVPGVCQENHGRWVGGWVIQRRSVLRMCMCSIASCSSTHPPTHLSSLVYFLEQLADARAIRSRIVECFERASYPPTQPTQPTHPPTQTQSISSSNWPTQGRFEAGSLNALNGLPTPV